MFKLSEKPPESEYGCLLEQYTTNKFITSEKFISFTSYNRQASPTDNPLYTTVDQPKPVKPRASSSSSKTNSSVKEPLDSSVPYAIPQKKKNKFKKSPKELQETTTSGEIYINYEMVQQKLNVNHLEPTYSKSSSVTVCAS